MGVNQSVNTQRITLTFLAHLFIVANGCGNEISRTKAQPESRYAIGKGSAYPSNPLNESERSEMQRSVLAQRQLAWHIVEKVVQDVSPAEGSNVQVPRFSTWYARNDFERWFQSTYAFLTPEQRRARVPLLPETIDQGESQLVDQVLTSPSWPRDRLNSWLAGLNSREKWLGTMGTARAIFSPAAAKHLIGSYKQINDCTPRGKDQLTAPCVNGDFPSDAVIVKAAWHRHGMNFPLSIFETSGTQMAQRLSGAGDSWDIPSQTTQTRPEHPGLMITTGSGADYQLTGLHIMSKESKDWVWISLWWSETPDEDFGEDRPASLAGVWSNYKMCVVTDFDDSALDHDELRTRYPSLALAIDAVKDNKDLNRRSWCSNPYLEKGANNQKTNCVGCHQYAGTSEDSNQIPSSVVFPDFGRARVLSSFATDYLWSITADPENLREKVRARVSYHDIYD
jgi:hypothetical protein